MAREPRPFGVTDRSPSAAGTQTLEAPVIPTPLVEGTVAHLPFDLAETVVVPVVPAPRRRRTGKRRRIVRVARVLLVIALVLTVLLALGGVAAYEDPALLSPVGSVLLGSRPGLVPWNGHDPLNLLVMGVDQRGTESTRSDSMIVLHVDPSSHDVTMLSVPRDLWINLPGYGDTKINAGYALGQPYGQGPQFAQFAVESALRIPINYVAVLKFSGFKGLVDAMGGVNVCVSRALHDTQYPDDTGFGYHTIDIKAGCQVMNGTTALVYARERHANAQQDLGRIEQQQAVVSGIEKSLLSPSTLVHLPGILTAADKAIDTTLPHAAALELGMLLARAGSARTQHVYINVDSGYVTSAVIYPQGVQTDVLEPNWDKIRPEMVSLFADAHLSNENASVQVLNGQSSSGLAATYTTVLQNIGFNTIAPANAGTTLLQRSIVALNLDHPGGDYTARVLGTMLGVAPSSAHLGADHAQVVATLGGDAVWGSASP